MAMLHFYPNSPNLFAMCGHNLSISFERSLSYLATSYEAIIQYEGNFPLFISHKTCEERVRGGKMRVGRGGVQPSFHPSHG